MMESQYQKKRDVTLSQMELQMLKWKKDQTFFDFAIDLHSMLHAAHPYLDAMALEHLGSTVLCEKVPYRWQQRLDEIHQRRVGSAFVGSKVKVFRETGSSWKLHTSTVLQEKEEILKKIAVA